MLSGMETACEDFCRFACGFLPRGWKRGGGRGAALGTSPAANCLGGVARPPSPSGRGRPRRGRVRGNGNCPGGCPLTLSAMRVAQLRAQHRGGKPSPRRGEESAWPIREADRRRRDLRDPRGLRQAARRQRDRLPPANPDHSVAAVGFRRPVRHPVPEAIRASRSRVRPGLCRRRYRPRSRSPAAPRPESHPCIVFCRSPVPQTPRPGSLHPHSHSAHVSSPPQGSSFPKSDGHF